MKEKILNLLKSIKTKFQGFKSKPKLPNFLSKLSKKNNTNQEFDNLNEDSDNQAISDGLKDKVKNAFESNKSKIFNYLKQSKTNKNIPSFFNKIDLTNILHTIFSPSSRAQINKVFLIAVFGSMTYGFGKGLALYLAGKPVFKKNNLKNIPVTIGRNKSHRKNMDKIKNKNLFDALTSQEQVDTNPQPVASTKNDSLVCTESEKKSSLPIKLLNTVVLQDSVKSIASVQHRSKDLLTFREGDKIKGLAQIGRIQPRRLIIKNLSSGKCEYISAKIKREKKKKINVLSKKAGKKLLNANNPSIKTDGNHFTIKKDYREKMLSNDKIQKILTQANAVKIDNPDGTLSFKMTEIVPGSLYTQLNIQEGDIINKINGKKIKSLNEIMGLFGKIKDIDHFELGIKRNGASQTMEYNFE